MKTLEEIIKEQLALPPILPDARKILGQIPGVVGVGVGFRTRAGRITDDIVLRVHVNEKRPLREIPKGDRIPYTFGGVPTDVTEDFSSKSAQADKFDRRILNTKASTLIGGLIISGPDHEGDEAFGTLGCFATLKSDRSVTVLLTNQHVLYENCQDSGEGALVGQPDISCSWCCKSGVIGQTMNGFCDTLVDCAIARLNKERPFIQKLPGLGKDINGRNEDLITGVPSPVPIIAGHPTSVLNGEPVRKVGRSTGPTSGIVRDVNVPITIHKGKPDERIMQEQIIVEVTKGPDLRGDGVMVFATNGDSGSVLVNRFNQVVGLIHKAPDPDIIAKDPEQARFAAACQIYHVTDKLQIDILKSPGVTTQDIPDIPTLPEVTLTGALIPGMRLAARHFTEEDHARAIVLEKIISELESSQFGMKILGLYQTHHAEIRQLINHDRKVKVVWHRSHGPAFMAKLMSDFRDFTQSIPKQIDGFPIESTIRRMAEVLHERGSVSLVETVDAYFPVVTELIAKSDTVAELLAYIQRQGVMS